MAADFQLSLRSDGGFAREKSSAEKTLAAVPVEAPAAKTWTNGSAAESGATMVCKQAISICGGDDGVSSSASPSSWPYDVSFLPLNDSL